MTLFLLTIMNFALITSVQSNAMMSFAFQMMSFAFQMMDFRSDAMEASRNAKQLLGQLLLEEALRENSGEYQSGAIGRMVAAIQVRLAVKVINCVSKMMSFVLKMMTFILMMMLEVV